MQMHLKIHLFLSCLLFATCFVSGKSLAVDNTALLKTQEAGAALVRGQFDRAIELYNEALDGPSLTPARMAALYNDRGVAKWRLQRHSDAIKDFNESIASFRDYASAYNNRGNVLLELNFAEEAIKDFDRAITLSAAYGSAYNNRANAHVKLGQPEMAVQDYSNAVEYMPTSAVPLNGRGKAHMMRKRYHAAIRDFTRAISLDTKYLSAFINRAQAFTAVNEHVLAVRDLDFVIANQPDQPRLYTSRGKVHQARGKYRPAWKDYSKAISLSDTALDAYVGLGAIKVASRKYKGALEDLSHAIEASPTLADAYRERAMAHQAMGEAEQAFKDIEKAVELDPENANVYLNRAQIFEVTGNLSKAVKDYRKSFDLDPTQIKARKAVERLTGEVLIVVVEKVGEPLDGWEVTREKSGRFVASNVNYARLKIPLEMYGSAEETPRLLEWSPLKHNFRGIGLLRYYAGTTIAPEKARIENIAVVDLHSSKVASIEPFKWGGRKSSWDWKDGSLVVTDHQGGANELRLRRPRYAVQNNWGSDETWYAQPGASGGWVYRNGSWVKLQKKRRKRKKKKSFFELLFN